MKLKPGDLAIIKRRKEYRVYSDLEGETALIISDVFIDARIGYQGEKHRWRTYKVLVRNRIEIIWVGFLKKIK